MTATTFSMNWIRLRCRIDPDTNCWLWLQGTNPSGAPVASRRNESGKKPLFQLRRVVWEHRNGPIPEGKLVTVSCKHANCLMHLELTTKAEVVRRQWTKADARAKLTAASTKAGRQRAKASPEVAREIRMSNDTLEVVAARHGISISLASMIRRGQRWQEVSNPFAGLGA